MLHFRALVVQALHASGRDTNLVPCQTNHVPTNSTNEGLDLHLANDLTSILNLSVGETGLPEILDIEGLFTHGSRPGRTFGESVDGVHDGILEMDSSNWSNGIRYHIFCTRPDTEFKADKT